MQFIAQIRLRDLDPVPATDGLLFLFMCQNRPSGECHEFEADSDGNHASVVPGQGLSLLLPPPVGDRDKAQRTSGPRMLPRVTGVRYEALPTANPAEQPKAYSDARQKYAENLLGLVSTQPVWVNENETPTCNQCGMKMRFAIQVESGTAGVKLGSSGRGYAFICKTCKGSAKFLVQTR